MSLWDSFSNYVEKEAERIKTKTRRLVRSKSDQQIRNLYNNRYNGNIKEWQIQLIEEEARRRGIS